MFTLYLEPGDLIHRLQFQKLVETPDPFGQLIETWTTLATVWARVDPLTGSEIFHAKQLKATVSHSVKMRYLGSIGDITPKDRFQWSPDSSGTKVLNVEFVQRDYVNGTQQVYVTELFGQTQ